MVAFLLYYHYRIGDGYMYDNPNNNQNFNNGVKPLFQNDFNNTNVTDSNFMPQQNGVYQNHEPGFQQQIPQNAFNPSFNNLTTEQNMQGYPQQGITSQSNTNVFPQQFQTDIQTDIPPELGEIKNLSDATVSSAPTMDVLNPMNIMPENPVPKDPLSAYESGNLNGFNSMNNNTYQNQVISQPNNYGFNGFQNNLTQPTSTMNPITQVPSFNNLSNEGQFNNFGQFNSVNSVQQNIPLSQPTVINNQNTPLDPMVNGLSSSVAPANASGNDYNHPNLASVQEMDNSFLAQNNNLTPQSQIPNLNEETKLYNGNLNEPLKDNNENSIISESQSVDLDSKDNVSTEDLSQKDTSEDMVSNQSQAEDLADETNLSDLGLDDSYSEPDTLDIMDLNEEETSTEKADDSKLSTSQMVDKIKDLIENLKSLGAKIDFEEFDFEQMYQLIIKIEK